MAIEQWQFDLAHSSIGFWVRHLMVSRVHGRFTAWSGTLSFDESDPVKGAVEIEVETASIDTKEPQRDTHLRSSDFLETEKYPRLTFKSSSVARADDGKLRVDGDLTIRGITRPVTLEAQYGGRVKDPWGGERVGFSAHTTILRKDFGLIWNLALEAGGLTVSDKVEIDIEVEAIRKA